MKLLIKLLFLFLLINIELDLCNCVEKINSSVKSSSKCGGRFFGNQYVITSPNYPDNYNNNLNCIYYLIGNNSTTKCSREEFHLEFIDFRIEISDKCSNDYLQIGNDNLYCGNRFGIRKFNSEDNKLKIIFHSDDNNVTDKGFRILVSTIPCPDYQSNIEIDVLNVPKNISQIKNESNLNIGKEKASISYPVYQPEVEFDNVNVNRRGDQSKKGDKIIRKLPEGLKHPAERFELPIFAQQHFHDDKCADNYDKFHIRESISPPKIHSYLYLPPPTINSEIIKIPFANNSSSKWLTYGVPDSSIPTNTYFDPLAHGKISPTNYEGNKNTHNSNPTFGNRNEGNTRNFNQPINPSINNFGNGREWNTPNFYPSINNFGNGREWSTPNFYSSINNIGNVNRYPELNFEDSDPSFGVNNIGEEMKNKNPINFGNYSPNRGSFGIDETTYNLFGGSNLNSECCTGSRLYSSENLLLVSRNFASLIKSFNNYECQYTLERNSQNICQLNINFKYFNFGIEDQFCNYGYLEIDGVRYCGCKTGIKITTKFDNISRKQISVNYNGYPKGKFGGFLLEVNQELCSTINNENFYRNINGKRNLNKRNIDENNFHSKEEEKEIKNIKKRDVGYVYENLMNFSTCRIFKFYNWVKAAKEIYEKNAKCSSTSNGQQISEISSITSIIPIFPSNENSLMIGHPSNENCEIINIVEGIISSINYPSNYPNDSSQCFRFIKAPGNCQLELAMLDFDLENSIFCGKDYISFGGLKRRYCGKSLIGSQTIFDLTRSSYADMYFVTDSYGNGRGFKIGFSQISC